MSRLLGGSAANGTVFANPALLKDQGQEQWLRVSRTPGATARQPFQLPETLPSRRYTSPTTFVSRGHELDADTIGLWRFDEQYVANRGTGNPVDEQGAAYTIVGGTLGFTQFTPIPGQHARKFSTNENNAILNDNVRLNRASSATLRSLLIGSWTVEMFIRLDSSPSTGSYYPFSHQGNGTLETAAHNALIQVAIGTDNKVTVAWESGPGTNEIVTATVTTLVNRQWHYLAITKDTATKTVCMYLDGVLLDTLGPYTLEPTDGSSGSLTIGSNNNVTGTVGSDVAIRSTSLCSVVKGQDWVDENWRRFTTSGTLMKDSTSFMTLHFMDLPSAKDWSPYGHDLMDSDGSGGATTAPVGSLIPNDQGYGRAFSSCVLSTGAFSKVIRDAMLADFTFELWVQIMAPVAATGNGIFHHTGDPALETQPHNRIGGNVLFNGVIQMNTEFGAGTEDSPTIPSLQSTPNQLEIGKRYHMAFRKTMTGPTWSGAVFINGVKTAESFNNTNYDGGTQANTVRFNVGGGTGIMGDQSVFFGFMDDARLSKVARTDSEILSSFRTGDNPVPGNLVTLIDPSPALGIIPGTRAQARYTALAFTCENGATTPFCLWAKFANDDQPVLVYDSTTGFAPLFNHPQSTWDLGTERMTLMQLGGWQDDIESICVGGQGAASVVPVRPGHGDDPPDDLSADAFGWLLPER